MTDEQIEAIAMQATIKRVYAIGADPSTPRQPPGSIAWRLIFARALLAANSPDAPLVDSTERVLLESDAFCPYCGHNRDTSSVSSIDHENGTFSCQVCNARWKQGSPDGAQQPQGDFDAARDCLPAFREVCKAVNETPMLQSMLYDLDLMPEQTMCDAVQWNRTCRVAEVVVNHLAEQKSPDRLA